MEFLVIAGFSIVIIWILATNLVVDKSIQETAESLYDFVCNLLLDNKDYDILLTKITNKLKPEYYIKENNSLIWQEEIFPDLTFKADKNYNKNDYSVYIYSYRGSKTKRYFGFSVLLDSPKCANEQTSCFRNTWIIQVNDSAFGCRAKRDAAVLGKTLRDIITSKNRNADYSRNWQVPGI